MKAGDAKYSQSNIWVSNHLVEGAVDMSQSGMEECLDHGRQARKFNYYEDENEELKRLVNSDETRVACSTFKY